MIRRNVILTTAGVFLTSSLPLIISIWIAGRSVYENRILVIDSRMTADLSLAAIVLEEHLDEASTDLVLLTSMIEASGVASSAGDALPAPVSSIVESLFREGSPYQRAALIDAGSGEIIDLSRRHSSEYGNPSNAALLQSLLSDGVGSSASETASAMAWHLDVPSRAESDMLAIGPTLTLIAPLNGTPAGGVALVLDASELLEHVFRVLANNDYLARPLLVTGDGDVLYPSSQQSSAWTGVSGLSEEAREALLMHVRHGEGGSPSPVTIDGMGRVQTIAVTPRAWRSEADEGLPAWTMVSYVANDTIGRLTPLQDPTWAPLSGTLRRLAFSITLLLASLSWLLAITLERLRAARQRFELDARFDPVTGLQNRRACEETLEAALRQAVRHGTVLSIAIIDVDFFKQVNDRFGHPAGDVVLRGIARMMQATLGSSKNLFRLGGEEFLVLLPGVALAEAVVRVDTVREAIATQDFDLGNGTQLAVTVSAGVAERNDGHATVSALLTAADAALYTAKREGRNCVRTFVEPSVN